MSTLKELLFIKAKLSFIDEDTVAFNRLFEDLQIDIADTNVSRALVRDETYLINLKELRDQLIGRRCGNGIVFTWGIANDGRLGIPIPDE